MEKSKLRSKFTHIYLPLLLFSIFLDEILNNFMLNVFNSRPLFQKGLFYGLFLLLQILISPIQAGFSDFYCRKKSLLFSLSISAFSLVLVYLYFNNIFSQFFVLALAMFFKSTMGNTLPLAWAGIADTKDNNYRFSLGLSTSIIALGYLALLAINLLFNEQKNSILILLLFIGLIPLFSKYFIDLVDRKGHRDKLAKELGVKKSSSPNSPRYLLDLLYLDSKIIWNRFIGCIRFRLGLLGVFLPIETSFYSTHALGVDLAVKGFEVVTMAMIFGYLVGVGFLKKLKNKSDHWLIRRGYVITILSFLPIYVSMPFLSNKPLLWLIAFCYFFYSFGVAFVVPSLFATLSKERDLQEQGKIYGLLDSTDTIALLLALIAGFIYNYFQHPFYIVTFSFITLLTSNIYYGKFVKTKKKETSTET